MVEYRDMRRSNSGKEQSSGNASRLTIGIAVADFNSDITHAMLAGARETLRAWKVKDADIRVMHVAGSYELPYACQALLKGKKKPHAVIALGCIIKGETDHDVYIAQAVAHGLMQVMLAAHTPIAFGVLTTNNLAQARKRSKGKGNKGAEAAEAALRLALQ